jgi:hypothetical protein
MTRNLVEYPITTEEILTALRKLAPLVAIDQGDKIGGLDVICIAEAIKRLKVADSWYVSRADDNGNVFVVREGLSESDANDLYKLLTERGHKQVYIVKQKDD